MFLRASDFKDNEYENKVTNSMSKKEKPEEVKPTIEDLHKKIKDVRKLADDSKAMLEERMKKRPLESASMIFVAGVILGVLIGSATARRS
jgi:F0F1-type ATP synthase assembly protein I